MVSPPPPPTLGAWLLQRARDHGYTGQELADLLHLPHHRIQQLAVPADLDDRPVGILRALARALELDWPAWFEPTPDQPVDSGRHPIATADDATHVHAVLALMIGSSLRHHQLADVLDWPIERVQTALASLPSHQSGLRLILDHDTAKLTIAPGALCQEARDRLYQIALQQQGPSPTLAYICYRLSVGNQQDALDSAQRNPDVLSLAATARLLDHSDGQRGRPAHLKLSPEVAFSLDVPTNAHDSFLLD